MSYQEGGKQNDQFCKLFVGGLSPKTTMESMKAYFEQFGSVSDAIVMKDKVTQRSKCFGFVTFSDSASVDKAQESRPHKIDDKETDTKRAVPRDDTNPESRVPAKKIFVGGLRKDITKEVMEEYFSSYGHIAECILVVDKATGNSKGFGFVTFEDNDTVDKVIIHRPHSINGSKADVKKALSKEEMNSMKQRQFGGQNGQAQGGYGQSNFYSTAQQAPYGGYGNAPNAYGDQSGSSWGQPQQQWGGGPAGGGGASGQNAYGGGGFGYYNQQQQSYGGPARSQGGASGGGSRSTPYQ